MAISLEDEFNDVLAKAARGRGKSPSALSAATGISRGKIDAILGGAFDAEAVRVIASSLGLDPSRVVALGEGRYKPAFAEVEGLRQFNTPFEDMTVNAYLVWDPASKAAAVFDTGSDVSDVLADAEKIGASIEQILLTHAHGDHIYDLDRLVEKTRARAWAPQDEPVEGASPFPPGQTFSIGALRVETRLTCGHSRGGVTYVIHGLARPVAICGDALFAGSMGGGTVSFSDALHTNREAIFSLPEDTILAPGHGPLTTVGEQRQHNPFFLK